MSKTRPREKQNSDISFYSKEKIECPVCKRVFQKEELRSGGGRLNADILTDELHRLYKPSKKYGKIFPLSYHLLVCPDCYFASFPSDFRTVDKEVVEKLQASIDLRKAQIKNLFHNLNFNAPRRLQEGAASYFLAIMCYEKFDPKDSPTIKQAICALRAAWMFIELGKKFPEENYTYVADLFYKKATFLYRYALKLETTGKEIIAGLQSFGPDTDKNYGFDGVIYITTLLEYKYGSKTNPEYREKILRHNRLGLAKMFGLGKASKSKPGPLLEKARKLYENIRTELNETDD